MNTSDIYRDARLNEFGFTLEQFQANPSSVLRECGQQTAPACIDSGFRPLLPAQASVAQRIQQEWKSVDKREVQNTLPASLAKQPAAIRSEWMGNAFAF